jgi:eukaryotic-like serine/threonine-protein kinase
MTIDLSFEKTVAPKTDSLSAITANIGKKTSTVLPRTAEAATETQPHRERFESLRLLGRGGMGEVLLAKDHDIERNVAVKRLQNGESVHRFAEEIRTMGQLDHPNIVPVHDVGVDDDGRYFFVMKHLRGESLEKIIENLRAGDPATHARFPIEYRVSLMKNVLNAIGYAHEQGILHRDLKPANIMVGTFGEVTVVDWGLAKRFKESTVEFSKSDSVKLPPRRVSGETLAGSMLGTPMYMSPEQARGETLDQRSDLFSLCVVFHEFLFLSHYLESKKSLEEILKGVETETAVVHPTASPKGQRFVPAELGWFLNKGLQKKTSERFQNAAEMSQELALIASGKFRIHCQRTMLKRIISETSLTVDRFPKSVIVLTTAAVIGLAVGLFGVISLCVKAM